MNRPSLPSTEVVENARAVVSVFGQFNLYDAELRAVRLTLDPGGEPALEAEFFLPGELAAGVAAPTRAAEYGITLRCTDIAGLGLADFDHQNVVGEYAFEAVAGAPEGRGVRVSITGAAGCDIEVHCRSVAVVAVTPARAADAA